MARKIEVQILGDASSLSRAFKSAGNDAKSFGSGLTSAVGTAVKAGVFTAAAAGIGAVAIGLRQGIKEYVEAAKVGAQTNAVIKSTGGVANVTAQDVDRLATSLMKKSGVDDEAIKSGENMLLTFTKVRNEVGQGNDIFTQATERALDLSVALGKDLPSSAMLVGKALNDPIKGMTAMTKAGIQFTDEQKKTIKSLVESGHAMEAQKIILKELETQFGGSAKAAGETLPGQLAILKESFNNFAGDLVAKAVPALQQFVDFINKRLVPAEGFIAKLKVIWQGVTEVGADLWDKIVAAWEGDQRTIAMDMGERVEVVGTEGLQAKLARALEDAQKGAKEHTKAEAKRGWDEWWADIFSGKALEDAATWTRLLTDTLWKGFVGGLRASSESVNRALEEVFLDPLRVLRDKVGPLVAQTVQSIISTFTQRIPAAFSAATALAAAVLAAIRDKLSELPGAVRDKLGSAVAAVRDLVGRFKDAAASIGRGIADGIVAGIGGLKDRLIGALTGALSSALSAVKGRFGIKSPSAWTAEQIGEPLAEGIIVGLNKTLIERLPKNLSDVLRTTLGAAGIDTSATDGGTDIATSLKGGIDTFLEDKLPGNLAEIIGQASVDAMSGKFLTGEPLWDWKSTAPLTGLQLPPPIPRSMSPDGAVTAPVIVQSDIYLDGEKIGRQVTKHQFERSRSGDTMPWTGGGFS